MRILKNKFFIFGNLFLLLIALPVILFFIKKQQETRTRAAPSTIISFNPSTISATKGQNFNIDVMVNPGQNIVSIVDMYLQFDGVKLKLTQISPNKDAFPTTLRGPVISTGSANISLNIGADVTRAIQTTTKVATLTFDPLAATPEGPTKISFDSGQTRVFSLSAEDQPGENVLASTQFATVTIAEAAGVSPTVAPPSPTSAILTPTPTTGGGAPPSTTPNLPPVCTSLAVDRDTTGTAPFSITFTATGNDVDDTISKVSFNFGDGPSQDVTQAGGIGTASVSVQASHTYQNSGTYSATATLVDDRGAVSSSSAQCAKTITVTKATGGGAGGSGGTGGGGGTSPTPKIESPGTIMTTLGVLGGILITIVGGALLLSL